MSSRLAHRNAGRVRPDSSTAVPSAAPVRYAPVRYVPAAPPVLLVLVVAVLVSGAACLLAVGLTPAEGQTYVAASAGTFAVLLSFALAALAYGLRQADRAQAHAADLDAQLARHLSETARLAEQTVPAVVKRLRDGASADTALADLPSSVDGTHYHYLMLRTLADEVGRGERMRAAAMSACANAAGRVQALATSMLADLRDMEERHDEKVLGDLLRLDHSTAQAGRLADSIAVLTGARSGRRWTKPIVMESILRGAVGRISAYQRVRVHSASNVAIAGYAAEGVMHTLAELMDNAANFSPPTEEVHVYVEDTQNGVIVTIEDGGLVMGPAALQRAEQAVSAEALDLTTLSGTRLGLAVVGCLARKHNLTVSFRPSSRGGTGVVVMLPRQLVAQPRPASRRGGLTPAAADTSAAPASAAPASAASDPPAGASRPGEEPVSDSTAGEVPGRPSSDAAHDAVGQLLEELPKRRRGETLASAPRAAAAAAASAADASPARSRVDPGVRFGAFRDASRRRKADTAAPRSPAATTGPAADHPPDRRLPDPPDGYWQDSADR